MLTKDEIAEIPLDNHAKDENLVTQPYKPQKIFGRADVLTKAWYPLGSCYEVAPGEARSYTILKQRVVVYRTIDKKLYALDSFCPHFGADLGNGTVAGNNIRCIYHHWEFSPEGIREKDSTGCNRDEKIKLNSYPVQEKFGYIWIFSDHTADHDIPLPPGLEGEVKSLFIRKGGLKVHPHVLMANAVDLVHFKTLHQLDVEFDYKVYEKQKSVFEWEMTGEFKAGPLPIKLAKFLFGPKFNYRLVYAGGTITGFHVSMPGMFNGRGPKFPAVTIIWGAKPNLQGTGDIYNFLIVKKYSGLFAPLKRLWAYFISFCVLAILRDDELYLFPHMRFSVGFPEAGDKSFLKFIQLINQLEISPWTPNH